MQGATKQELIILIKSFHNRLPDEPAIKASTLGQYAEMNQGSKTNKIRTERNDQRNNLLHHEMQATLCEASAMYDRVNMNLWQW